MLALTKGWDQQRVSDIVRETLDEVLTPIIYAEALELIEEHKKAGHKTVIVSSSPIETVQPLGEHLGVDDVIATRAKLDADGRYTGELEFYAYGPHKADAIREMAVNEGIDLANSFAYSDSITDLPMLELVGNPVAVNPDRELTRVRANASGTCGGSNTRFDCATACRFRQGPDAGGRHCGRRGRDGNCVVRLAAPARARNELGAGADTRSQAVRTFFAMTAPSATTTSSNKIFFTDDPPLGAGWGTDSNWFYAERSAQSRASLRHATRIGMTYAPERHSPECSRHQDQR